MSLVVSHLKMLSDHRRLESYRQAIFQTVKKGDVVADIGTGTGVLAVFAVQAGAKKVYAVEISPIIDVAKKTAKENGCFDSIEFIQKESKNVDFAEPINLIVTETIGALGIDERIVDILSDVRKRFLDERGRIIPASLSLLAAPVSFTEGHPFRFLDRSFHGIQTQNLKRLAVNNIYGLKTDSLDQTRLVSKPTKIFEAHFYSCEPIRFPLHMDGSFEIFDESILDGIMVFPEIGLTDEITLSLWEEDHFLPTHWDVSFFPMSEEIMTHRNDIVSFRLTFTEKNGLIWQVGVEGEKQKKVLTQLSTFGLPSLRHLMP
ncbi:MAG: 50S ribosomal protein L11 methyltransferase [Deltaproteobacteria bacterium]|nr:50S ribosomal protein L11 methyltransferase [Deltaproteobacteria bacterium]